MRLKIFSASCFSLIIFLSSFGIIAGSQKKADIKPQARLSSQSQACIGCHKLYTPGIVEDWLTSRHAETIPSDALKRPPLERRTSADTIPQGLMQYAVGCYECHSQNPDTHEDNFQHMGYRINIVVTPNDCKICHPVEADQYKNSKKAYAVKNLMENPVYEKLVIAADSITKIEKGEVISQLPSENTLHETCLGCHGTTVHVKGVKDIYVGSEMGTVTVPDLANWPNQGVGRVNPDGSLGTCAACHTRHAFSIEVARKPYTCAQCHLEPDVPAWNVYKESKHGNIFSSLYHEWNFNAVPWIIGKDFKAPTCSTCHNSLTVTPNGKVIAERTHDFGSRLWVRLFGLIYSHPQPKSGDTTLIRNKDGLPLPVTFQGDFAEEYLIGIAEQEERLHGMESICNNCHSLQWVRGHFSKLEKTINETDKMTLATTKLMLDIWERGIEDNANPFDGSLERMWASQWLFYANSIRYASAMTGAPDYATFKNGWWKFNENIQLMKDWIGLKEKGSK
jgi:hydroxylamine dehydrogenase